MTEFTTLYRHYDNKNNLLYVGVACNFITRTECHESYADWFGEIAYITLEHFSTRQQAIGAESKAISLENPKYNKQRSSEGAKSKISIAIPEPLNQQLKKKAKKDGMSLSALISHLLMNALEE